eukprot:TRINITY_DN17544_c0_g1_i1.p1 TRINITY_DN17544_c0_g1~~TRINITY_DN17544_c0_g1_i1.p1  ORF type:complete len:209 (-),score=31.23 TRINITY_DN17544_c0_g1_i1:110-736(-)
MSRKPLGAIAAGVLQAELKQQQEGDADDVAMYQEEQVKAAIQEIHMLDERVQESLRNSVLQTEINQPHTAAHIIAFKAAALRNKRCLMAHQKLRQEAIMRQWQKPSTKDTADTEEKLSPAEKEFRKAYDNMMSEYGAELQLNLRLDTQPPDILATQTAAQQPWYIAREEHEVLTDTGSGWGLNKGDALIAPHRTAQDYVHQGLLQKHT